MEKDENKHLGYTRRREWIVVTTGACVIVYLEYEPETTDAGWPKKN